MRRAPSGVVQPRTRKCCGSKASTVKPSVAPGNAGKDHADREFLELGDGALSARPASVVEKVIAVPAGTTPSAHLREPRPDFLSRSSNGDRVIERADRFLDQLIAGQRVRLLLRRRTHGPPSLHHSWPHRGEPVPANRRATTMPRRRGLRRPQLELLGYRAAIVAATPRKITRTKSTEINCDRRSASRPQGPCATPPPCDAAHSPACRAGCATPHRADPHPRCRSRTDRADA